MKVRFVNSTLNFEVAEKKTEISIAKQYVGVVANRKASDTANAGFGSSFTTYFYEIPQGATSVLVDCGISPSTGIGISLVKDVNYGDEIPSYVNVGKNLFLEEFPDDTSIAPIRKIINLSEYAGSKYIMFSASKGMYEAGTGGKSTMYAI